jgi:hypothetical protein
VVLWLIVDVTGSVRDVCVLRSLGLGLDEKAVEAVNKWRSHHPGKPSGFQIRGILGSGDRWITEYTITYQGHAVCTVSIMDFQSGKVVHETQYFADPIEAPVWRDQWVEANGVEGV